SPSTAVTSGPAPTARRGNLDTEVRTTSNDPTIFRSELHSPKIVNAGEFAAVVGNEVITLHELTMAVKDKLKNVPQQQRPSSKQQMNMVGAAVLAELIRESILYQEAKSELKNPKQLQMFMDFAEKVWNEDELPPMMKKAACVNEYELKKKLEDEGTSLNQLHETFRRNFLAHSFVKNKLGAKMTVSLPEMRDYYNTHIKDYEQPAMITWREIVVEVDKQGGPVPAKKKADAILARLLKGEDFVKVCKADSDGPDLSKKEGGLWKTSPGSYGVEAVNQALEALEVGKLSRVIEGPASLHIVRVEGRRPAGPTSFADIALQDKIREKVYKEKVDRITNAFIEKIRSETPIRTMFDGTESDPKLARRMTHN
ncbi:peptidylprolyl isomerase, partial [Singulisphaera rosea]